MSKQPKLTITIDNGLCNEDLIYHIEQELDKVLVPVGFKRTGTSKGENVVIEYFQFGKAIDREGGVVRR